MTLAIAQMERQPQPPELGLRVQILPTQHSCSHTFVGQFSAEISAFLQVLVTGETADEFEAEFYELASF